MPKTLLVAADIDRSFFARAQTDDRFAIVHKPVRTEDELAAIIGDAQILVTRAYNKVTRRVIDAAPRLELIAQGTSGIDNIDGDAARERGIAIINLPGANANAVLEADDASDIENYDARATGFARFAEAPRSVVVEVRNYKHLASSPAEAVHSAAIGAGEGRNLRLW